MGLRGNEHPRVCLRVTPSPAKRRAFFKSGAAMIVYKYMSLVGLDACLSNRTIRFTKPTNFNDPFDCAASADDTMQGLNIRTAGPTNSDRLACIRNAIGILSLTRNPLNPLMWAHYGQNHTGGVVAIDAEAAGLECADSNIITASTGNIIYTTVRPTLITWWRPAGSRSPPTQRSTKQRPPRSLPLSAPGISRKQPERHHGAR